MNKEQLRTAALKALLVIPAIMLLWFILPFTLRQNLDNYSASIVSATRLMEWGKFIKFEGAANETTLNLLSACSVAVSLVISCIFLFNLVIFSFFAGKTFWVNAANHIRRTGYANVFRILSFFLLLGGITFVPTYQILSGSIIFLREARPTDIAWIWIYSVVIHIFFTLAAKVYFLTVNLITSVIYSD
jgi:hypothetical protein